jgi:hypothetical protein
MQILQITLQINQRSGRILDLPVDHQLELPEEMRTAAVAYAKKQVEARKPYVWGSEGPNTFDCSGLVYASYRAAGLGWPKLGST